MGPEKREKSITGVISDLGQLIRVGFDEYRRNVTGKSGDGLMILAARSETVAAGALGALAIGVAIGRLELAAAGGIVALLGNMGARVASGAAIRRDGDPLGWFPKS